MTAYRLPFVLILVLALTVFFAGIWGAAALWFRMPGPDALRYIVLAFLVFVSGGAFFALFKTRHLRPFLVFAALFAVLLAWWSTLTPPTDTDFAPDVARQVTGKIEGDQITLSNIRDFEWTGPQEAGENWLTDTYDLSQMTGVDMLLSYWGDPKMAHFILSFGFADGRQLAWSVEVKRSRTGGFSPIADLFRANPLVIVAATERDVVGVRTNHRGEDVLMLRLAASPAEARLLFEQYVTDANELAAEPAWYNSLATNCTTVVFRMIQAAGGEFDLDWRILVNGYLPEYIYDRGSVVNDISVEELRELGRISAKGQAAGLADSAAYSAAIRAGVPLPARTGVVK